MLSKEDARFFNSESVQLTDENILSLRFLYENLLESKGNQNVAI